MEQLVLPLLLVVGVILLFRSQRRRQNQAQQLQSKIEPGVQICTTSGLFGTVVSLDEKAVVLEAAPGVNLRFDRRAIALVVPSEAPPALESPADDADDTERPSAEPDHPDTDPSADSFDESPTAPEPDKP